MAAEVRKAAQDVPAGSTAVTHGLGTTDLIVAAYLNDQPIDVGITVVDDDTIQVDTRSPVRLVLIG